MSIEYRFVFDESYLGVSLTRSLSQRPLFLRPSVQVPLLILVAVGGWYFFDSFGLTSIASAFVALAGVAIVGQLTLALIMRSAMLKHLRKSPEFGGEVTATLSESGLDSTAPLSKGTVKWAALQSAVRYADGIMLERGRLRVWLPDAALKGSTSQDATDLVSAHTDLRLKG